VVYKFDPVAEKIKKCKGLADNDRFLIGMGITDGGKEVCALGESGMHMFDGENWKKIDKP
jgi:hypothetical protein